MCGSNITGSGWPDSEMTGVRLSALGDQGDLTPEMHIWVRSVAPWRALPEDGLPRYDEGAVRQGYLLQLGETPYVEAWELQRSLAAAVQHGAIPDTVLLLEHPPVVTVGRRTDDTELHVPDAAEVQVVETNRGGKSTYHAPASSSATRSSTSTGTAAT